MVLILPFLMVALSVCYGMMGKRRPSVVFWLLSLVLFVGLSQSAMRGMFAPTW